MAIDTKGKCLVKFLADKAVKTMDQVEINLMSTNFAKKVKKIDDDHGHKAACVIDGLFTASGPITGVLAFASGVAAPWAILGGYFAHKFFNGDEKFMPKVWDTLGFKEEKEKDDKGQSKEAYAFEKISRNNR